MQCDGCKKWRCVAEECLASLRCYDFFEPKATDQDWNQWLCGAGQRYAAVERVHAGEVDPCVVVDGVSGVEAKIPVTVVAAATEVQKCQRAKRKKTPVNTSPGVECTQEQGAVSAPAVVVSGVSDESDFGVRSASDRDCASGGGEAEERAACTVPAGVGVRQRAKRMAQACHDVSKVLDRLVDEMVIHAQKFCHRKVSTIEAKELVGGWFRAGWRADKKGSGRALSKEAEDELAMEERGEVCRLGRKILELASPAQRRAWGLSDETASSPEDFEAKLVVVEEKFCAVVPRPRARFECSMVQTAVESAEGVVSWRDVTCGDVDDFDALCSRRWMVTDFAEEEDLAYFPYSRPESWKTPADMCAAMRLGADGGGIVYRGKVAKKPQVGVVKDSGVARDVLGDHSRFNGRVQCAYGLRPLKGSTDDPGRDGKRSAASRGGRPPKRGSRWDKYSKLAMHPCLLYTSPSPRDQRGSRMPSSA